MKNPRPRSLLYYCGLRPLLSLWTMVFVLSVLSGRAQIVSGHFSDHDSANISCGQKEVNDFMFRTRPDLRSKNAVVENQWRQFLRNQPANDVVKADGIRRKKSAASSSVPLATVVTLPVVVHLVHNNGPENISNAQVFNAIQHLNEAFANSGFYDPADGINTNIQFCLAERDTANVATNGITRNVSPYTVMGGPSYYSDDQNVKNINRWTPSCYVNIWVVNSIPGSVAGYAYLPAAHGGTLDGIIVEAGYFGSSYTNDVVITHEMGHYLGLYHTFEGGCGNTDCSVDGDRICDTPPDNSTAYISCGSSMNSCSTDALSGFAVDQPDLTQDYMDYGNFNCMKVFTPLQSARMNFVIQNIRSSLLHCKSCLPPCPSPVVVAFTVPPSPLNAGTTYTFTNTSVNASGYEWRVNGAVVSTLPNLTFTFAPPGNYTVTLIARSGNILCDSAAKTVSLSVVCPVNAAFNKSAATAIAGSTISFTNTSSGAGGYQWLVNGVLQSTGTNFTWTTSTAGNYAVTLKATNTAAGCADFYSDTVLFTCPVVADFTPLSVTTVINSAVNFTSTGSGAGGYQWAVNGSVLGSGTSFTNTFTAVGSYSVKLTAGNGVCSSVKTGVVYVTDKCGNPVYLFRKVYDPGQPLLLYDLRATADGGSIAAGQTVAAAVVRGALVKLDPQGTVSWFKNYGNSHPARFVKVRTTSDGGYIAIGEITAGAGSNKNCFIVKTAADGTLQWSRQLALDGISSGTNIIQSAEGDFYFTATLLTAGSANGATGVLIGKLTATGTQVWLRSYDDRGTATPNSLLAEAGSLTVCGNLSASATGAGFLLHVNKTDGLVVWSRSYTSGAENFTDILPTASGYLVDVVHGGGLTGVNGDHVFLFTDGFGGIISANAISPLPAGFSVGNTNTVVKPNGNLVSQTSPGSGGTYTDFVVQEINPASGPVWSKKYAEPDIYITGMAQKPDNGFFLAGYRNSGTFPGYIMSVDSLGEGGTCPANPAESPWRKISYQRLAVDWTSKLLQAGFVSNHSAADQSLTTDTHCQYIGCDSVADSCALCRTVVVVGPDTLCASHGTYTFLAGRSAGCASRVVWSTDNRLVSTVRISDSTIAVDVTGSGSFSLIATLITSCDTLRDTIKIHAYAQPNIIKLGPDIALCKSSAVHLNAGSGFSNYTWQDGSTDSSFTAYFPGTYFVEATDFCHNFYRDTIVVTQAPDVPFDLGADTTICMHDSVMLHAPGGFSSYYWTPVNYAISDPYAQNPWVHPSVDTSYTCTVQKYPGCSVVDTVRIHVIHNEARIFPDSALLLCTGGDVEIFASGAWTSYLWSTGSTARSIRVAAAGDYWLQAGDQGVCATRDTLTVTAIDCYSGVHFPNAFTPNGDGNNDTFKALLGLTPKTWLLVVYNRWGEKVFETQDPHNGWNGVFKGVKQDSGGFAWYAVYRLTEKTGEETQKGMLMLLR